MPASDLTSTAMVFAAMCGGSPPPEEPTSTGLTCSEYNLMIKVEIIVGGECDFDSECDQVLPAYDDACPTADRILSSEFDTEYVLDLIEDAEREGCTVVYYGDRGDCSADAEPLCSVGTCRWE